MLNYAYIFVLLFVVVEQPTDSAVSRKMLFASQVMDLAFTHAVEESLMMFTAPGNVAFLEAMPPKASRAILKMWRSPYSLVRDDGQRELKECGVEWNYWALHIPDPEVFVRAQVNLYNLTQCPKTHQYYCAGCNTIHQCNCEECDGVGSFWDLKPFLEIEAKKKREVATKAKDNRQGNGGIPPW